MREIAILFLLVMPWASITETTGLFSSVPNRLHENVEFVSLSDDALTSPCTEAPEASYPPWTSWTVKGVQNILVLLVEFPDVKHSIAETTFEATLKSMNDYYTEVSYGKTSLRWSIASSWRTLPRIMSYYGEPKEKLKDANRWKLVVDSITASQTIADFTQFEYMMIIHAGKDEASSKVKEDIWSFCYCSFGHAQKLSYTDLGPASRQYWGIAVVSEEDSMGIFAHEFGHALGLPDLYDSEYEGDEERLFVSDWSLMSYGSWLPRISGLKGTRPCHLDSWSKIMLGWAIYLVSKPSLAESDRRISPLAMREGPHAVKIEIDSYHYYLVEMRTKAGFDECLPSEGVLILLIDDTRKSGAGIVKVMDGTPSTKTLNDAPFKAGASFKDEANRIYVTVPLLSKTGGILLLSNRPISPERLVATEIRTASVTGRYSDKISLKAQLVDNNGTPINGALLLMEYRHCLLYTSDAADE